MSRPTINLQGSYTCDVRFKEAVDLNLRSAYKWTKRLESFKKQKLKDPKSFDAKYIRATETGDISSFVGAFDTGWSASDDYSSLLPKADTDGNKFISLDESMKISLSAKQDFVKALKSYSAELAGTQGGKAYEVPSEFTAQDIVEYRIKDKNELVTYEKGDAQLTIFAKHGKVTKVEVTDKDNTAKFTYTNIADSTHKKFKALSKDLQALYKVRLEDALAQDTTKEDGKLTFKQKDQTSASLYDYNDDGVADVVNMPAHDGLPRFMFSETSLIKEDYQSALQRYEEIQQKKADKDTQELEAKVEEGVTAADVGKTLGYGAGIALGLTLLYVGAKKAIQKWKDRPAREVWF